MIIGIGRIILKNSIVPIFSLTVLGGGQNHDVIYVTFLNNLVVARNPYLTQTLRLTLKPLRQMLAYFISYLSLSTTVLNSRDRQGKLWLPTSNNYLKTGFC